MEIIALFYKDHNYYKILMMKLLVRQATQASDWYLELLHWIFPFTKISGLWQSEKKP